MSRRISRKYAGLLALTAALAFLGQPNARAASGAADVASGNRQFRAGDYKQALESYRKAAASNPGEAAIDYNLGAAYYKEGEYDQAVESFRHSLLTDDEGLGRNARFNLGNSLYRAGAERECQRYARRRRSGAGMFPQYRRDPHGSLDCAAGAHGSGTPRQVGCFLPRISRSGPAARLGTGLRCLH